MSRAVTLREMEEDGNPFGEVSAFDLMDVVQAYVKRTYDEDLVEIQKLVAQSGDMHVLCQKLRSSPDEGTNDTEELKQSRETVFGRNVEITRKPTPFWYLVWSASKEPILRVLMVAAIISLGLGLGFGERKEIEWIEGAAIFLAVVIVLLVTAGNDWVKEKQFAVLIKSDEKFGSCRRNGIVHLLPVDKLVVGDIILVEAGDEIPTDCLVVSCRDLALDESSMTGESDPVKKDSLQHCLKRREELQNDPSLPFVQLKHHAIRSPVVLSGSTVVTGSGVFLIIAVGENSQSGQLLQKLTINTDPTPLQNKLNALASSIGTLGMAAAVLTLVVLILEYWILYFVHPDERPDSNAADVFSSHIKFIVEAITIVVVAVPEGLPLAVTISLAFSVGRMLKDQNYVRRLAACETMGGANEICSDKTGTLTKNQMAVSAFWNGTKLSEMNGVNALAKLTEGEPLDSVMEGGQNSPLGFPVLAKEYFEILIEAIALNSTAYLEEQEVAVSKAAGGHGVTTVKHVGSPTECALLQLLTEIGFDYNKIRNDKGREEQIIHRIPFNSDRKLMTTVVACPDKPNFYRVYVKGAAEIVLRLCHTRIDSSGSLRAIDPIHIDRIERQVIDPMTSHSLRTICLAYKDFDPNVLTNWDQPADPSDIPTSSTKYPRRASAAAGGKHLLPPMDSIGQQPLQQQQPVSSSTYAWMKKKTFYHMELDLNCLGIAGMSDPVREEVPPAVRRCQDAGIRVRMVTGDNIETAKQIGIKCNIYHPEMGGLAMTGAEFQSLIGGIVCEECRTTKCLCPTSLANRKTPQQKKKKKESVQPISPTMNPLPRDPLDPPPSSDDQATSPFLPPPPPSSQSSPISIELPFVKSNTHSPGHTTRNSTENPTTASSHSPFPSNLPTPSPSRTSRCSCSACLGRKHHHALETVSTGDEETESLLTKKVRVDALGNMEAFKKIADKLEILARSQPNDKYALVLGLKALGAVVAVTGDGTNDAPALKKADVGFAMGIAGKEVAKQAADIVLLDDNFESIVKAVKWGRNIYDNIRRFLQFQLTVNVVAVLTAFIGSVVLRSSPLNAVQLLWVNLIMDTFASLALATEPPTDKLLDRLPHSRTDYLVNRLMTRNILGQATFQIVVMMVLVFTGERWLPERSSSRYIKSAEMYEGYSQFSPYNGGQSFVASGRRFKPFSYVEEYKHTWAVNIGPSRHFTIIFNTFVWLQIFNMLNARKIENEINVFGRALANPLWLFIIILISVLQIIMTEFGGFALQCHLDGLTWSQWGICLLLGSGSLLVHLLLHIIPAEKIKYIPQAGSKESDLLTGSTSLAMASRGRVSSGRTSSRLAAGLHNPSSRPSSAAAFHQPLHPSLGLAGIHGHHQPLSSKKRTLSGPVRFGSL